MPDSDLQIEALGEIYAQALINEAQKRNVLPEITDNIRGIGELLTSNKDFLAFVQAISISEDDRLGSLEKIFASQVHPLTLNVLKSLARRERLVFLPGLVKAFEVILRHMDGRVEVELVSALELSPEVIDRVRDAVAKRTGKTIEFRTSVDPSLIGGMTLTMGDTLVDGSVATQLSKMKEQMKRGGSLKMDAVVSA
jgi:F-type H+-transporting ATPase subunit delta